LWQPILRLSIPEKDVLETQHHREHLDKFFSAEEDWVGPFLFAGFKSLITFTELIFLQADYLNAVAWFPGDGVCSWWICY
jgi:hypothetical protein